jgi:hypothetical protein
MFQEMECRKFWIQRDFISLNIGLKFNYNVVVPVSASKLPDNRWDGWDAGYANGRVISISVISPKPKPGESVSGIELNSRGLPGVRRMTVLPWFDERLFFPAIDDTSETALEPFSFEKEDSLRDMVNYYGWTIGPYAPPAIFNPNTILDTLTYFTTQSRMLGWIKDQTTANKYLGYFASAKTSLQQNSIIATRTTLQQVLQDANVDSTANLTSEAYALIRYNTEYLLAQLPVPPSGCNVKLVNSTGTKLTSGALQYYEGAWKDAVNNNDGTFFVNTTKTSLSLRMTYAYGTQTKSNVTVGYDTIVFQTVNAQIQLQNSSGALIDTGSVQYTHLE